MIVLIARSYTGTDTHAQATFMAHTATTLCIAARRQRYSHFDTAFLRTLLIHFCGRRTMYEQFVVLRYETTEEEGVWATHCYYTLYSSVIRVAHTLDTAFIRAPLIHFCGHCTMYEQFVVLRYETTEEGGFWATHCYYTLYSSVIRVAHTLDTAFMRAPLIHFCGRRTTYEQFVVLRYETTEEEGFWATHCYYTLYSSVIRVAHTLDTAFLRAPLIHFCGLYTMYDQFVILRYETAEREGFEATHCYYTLYSSVVRVAHTLDTTFQRISPGRGGGRFGQIIVPST